jgi:hypothetical protein
MRFAGAEEKGMSIVQFPVGRLAAGRAAFRGGLAYCAACAAPIDFGAVWRGEEAYCSVECSLGGGRPA